MADVSCEQELMRQILDFRNRCPADGVCYASHPLGHVVHTDIKYTMSPKASFKSDRIELFCGGTGTSCPLPLFEGTSFAISLGVAFCWGFLFLCKTIKPFTTGHLKNFFCFYNLKLLSRLG